MTEPSWVERVGQWVERVGQWVERVGQWVERVGQWVERVGLDERTAGSHQLSRLGIGIGRGSVERRAGVRDPRGRQRELRRRWVRRRVGQRRQGKFQRVA